MEFTRCLPAFSLTKTELFARVVGGVERQNASNKSLWLTGPESTRCHFPFPKVINALRVKAHWFGQRECKIINLKSYHFHACL